MKKKSLRSDLIGNNDKLKARRMGTKTMIKDVSDTPNFKSKKNIIYKAFA